MGKQKLSRLLINSILAAALLSALGSEALAGAPPRNLNRGSVSDGAKTLKPVPGPMAGEPDFPSGGSLPPKDGTYPTGGAQQSTWAMRVYWSIQVMLHYLPKRIP